MHVVLLQIQTRHAFRPFSNVSPSSSSIFPFMWRLYLLHFFSLSSVLPIFTFIILIYPVLATSSLNYGKPPLFYPLFMPFTLIFPLFPSFPFPILIFFPVPLTPSCFLFLYPSRIPPVSSLIPSFSSCRFSSFFYRNSFIFSFLLSFLPPFLCLFILLSFVSFSLLSALATSVSCSISSLTSKNSHRCFLYTIKCMRG